MKAILEDFKKNSINVFTVPGNHDRRGIENPEWILDTVLPQNDLNNYNNYMGQYDKSQGVIDKDIYKIIGVDSGADPDVWKNIKIIPSCEDGINNQIDLLRDLVVDGVKGTGLSTDQIKSTNDKIKDDKTIIFMHHPVIDKEFLFDALDNTCHDYWNERHTIKENREIFIKLMKDRKCKISANWAYAPS